MIAWALFYNPILVPQAAVLWLILPLCLSVAVVYKTVRTVELRRLPREIVGLMLYMIGGLVVLGVVLWGVQSLFL
ncbi:MAG: hypothetical protein JW849_05585 [Phycisphaerae bacterium]|nr:hypothetical protein [Phycisphaerae bacterium]